MLATSLKKWDHSKPACGPGFVLFSITCEFAQGLEPSAAKVVPIWLQHSGMQTVVPVHRRPLAVYSIQRDLGRLVELPAEVEDEIRCTLSGGLVAVKLASVGSAFSTPTASEDKITLTDPNAPWSHYPMPMDLR